MRRKCGDDQTLRWHCLRSPLPTSLAPPSPILSPYDLTPPPPLCNLPAPFYLELPELYTLSFLALCFMMSEGGIEAEVAES
jgi:hypothetical protein